MLELGDAGAGAALEGAASMWDHGAPKAALAG
jgi:hypothetical protein